MKLLERFSFLPLFDCVVGSDFEGKRSKSDMIPLCMNNVEINDPGECLMVGDTQGDVNAAYETGVHALGVTCGFGFSQKDYAHDFLMADSCENIITIVQI